MMFAALLLFMGGLHAAAVKIAEPDDASAAASLHTRESDFAPGDSPAVVAQVDTASREELRKQNKVPPGAWICTAKSPTKVTIALYGTPQCAITRAWYLGTIAPLAKQHPDKVSVVMGQFWFPAAHPQGEEIARLMLAARQHGKFCRAMNALFEILASGPRSGYLTPARKQSFATKVELDLAALEAEGSSAAVSSALQADKDYAASVGVKATPTIFVNGRPLPRFDKQVLRAMVEEELKK